MRQWLYNNLVNANSKNPYSTSYNILMIIAVVLGIVPLMFRDEHIYFHNFEVFCCSLFVFDYIINWLTIDYSRNKKGGLKSFLFYPFTAWAIIDLLTILPLFNIFNKGFLTLRLIKVARILRILRLFKKSQHLSIIVTVIRSELVVLSNVLFLCVVYIFISALIMFNFEYNIDDFLDALYWATTALTTVGYGDICPSSDIGKIISMISSLFGIAVVALPAGIITARYLDELNSRRSK